MLTHLTYISSAFLSMMEYKNRDASYLRPDGLWDKSFTPIKQNYKPTDCLYSKSLMRYWA